MKELETLSNHLFYANERTKREMWILAAFVSINESERRLKQCFKAQKAGVDSLEIQRLFEASVAELWQAVFLVAQTPV